MTDIDIEQAIATGESQLAILSYSKYLKQRYGIGEFCGSNEANCLLINLWAAGGWDNRPGATNPYTQRQLNGLLTKLSAQ